MRFAERRAFETGALIRKGSTPPITTDSAEILANTSGSVSFINAVTQELGAANYLITISQGFLTPELLVASTFLLTAFISFSTGTSWGAFAMMVPIALPLAYGYTDNQIDPLIFKTVAAIAGGGIFGDHASPVSDTSVSI